MKKKLDPHRLHDWTSLATFRANLALSIVPSGVFFCLLIILLFNVSRGFDITDESFYLLSAMQPDNLLFATTNFGYYTHILYLAAAENIATFRVMGIFILIGMGCLLSASLECYWKTSPEFKTDNPTRWENLAVIQVGILGYYNKWSYLTPSYNWLALFSVIAVAIGLLRLNRSELYGELTKNVSLNTILSSLIVGFGGGMAFMAKPTTAAVLAVISILWILVHPTLKDRKLFLLLSILFSGTFVVIHTVNFNGGINKFFYKLISGAETVKILDAGHDLMSLATSLVNELTDFISEFVLFAVVLLIFIMIRRLWYRLRPQCKSMLIYESFLVTALVLSLWIYFLLKGRWTRFEIGSGCLTILLIMLIVGWLIHLSDTRLQRNSLWSFKKLIILCVFLILLTMAYSFGTAGGFLRKISGAYVFLIAAAYYVSQWIDTNLGRRVLGRMVPALFAISVFIVVYHAYNKPFRMVSIKKQTEVVSFLSGGGQIYVDKVTSQYIKDLKNNAINAGWKEGMPMIDLTGGSPGASVILGSRILATPWLLGNYKGSNSFAKASLSMVEYKILKTAWVLTAPGGRRKLSESILPELGLDYPASYEVVGKVRTMHRNEVQFLWKPLYEKG